MRKGKVSAMIAGCLVLSMLTTACGSSAGKTTEIADTPVATTNTTQVETSTDTSTVEEQPVTTEVQTQEETKSEEVTVEENSEETSYESDDFEYVEPVALSGNYLKKFSKLELIDYKIVDFCKDFLIGDTIKVSVTLEGNGSFAGGLGTCEGANDDWNQQKYEAPEGEETTWTATFTPSIDTFQLNIWWMDENMCNEVGVKSIKVTLLQHNSAAPVSNGAPLTGEYSKIFRTLEFIDLPIKNYCAAFNPSDSIEVSVTLEGNGGFSGGLGTCEGLNYDWNQQKYEAPEGGEVTWTANFNAASIDTFQLNIWWMNATEVGVKAIEIKQTAKGSGMPEQASNGGSAVASYSGGFKAPSIPAGAELFAILSSAKGENDPESSSNSRAIDVYRYIPDLKQGDTVRVTIATTADSWYGGGLYTLDDGWKHDQFSNENAAISISGKVGPKENPGFGVQLWWLDKDTTPYIYILGVEKIASAPVVDAPAIDDDTSVKLVTLTADKKEDSEETSENVCKINVADYLEDVSVGDEVTVTIGTSSASWYGGAVYYSSEKNNEWRSVQFSNDPAQGGPNVSITGIYEGPDSFGVQLWWHDGNNTVDIYLKEVTKGASTIIPEAKPAFVVSEESTENKVILTTALKKLGGDNGINFSLTDYLKDLSSEDKVLINVSTTGETVYNGGIVCEDTSSENNESTIRFNTEGDVLSSSKTITVGNDKWASLQLWWNSDDTKEVAITVTLEKVVSDNDNAGNDNSDDTNTDNTDNNNTGAENTVVYTVHDTLNQLGDDHRIEFYLFPHFNEGDKVQIKVTTSASHIYNGVVRFSDASAEGSQCELLFNSETGINNVEKVLEVSDNPWGHVQLYWNDNGSNDVDITIEFIKAE